MKKNKLLYGLCLTLSACAIETRVILDEFRSPKIKQATLNVINLEDSVIVYNMDDFKDDFKSDNGSDSLALLLQNHLPLAIKKVTYFSNVQFVKFSKSPSFEEVCFKIPPRDSIVIRLPKNFNINEYINSPSDYCLILSRFNTFIETLYNGQFSHKALAYDVCYCLIENKTARIISYGVAHAVEAPFMSIVTKNTWINNISNLPTRIFNGTAFGRY